MRRDGVERDIGRRLDLLRAEASATGPLSQLRVVLPHSEQVYDLVVPSNVDALLDQAEADPEQNLPYWAEVWPSGIALADAILARPELLRGRRVLELGSGLGVTAVAALRAGASLTVADYAPESLLLCRANALRNAGREPETVHLNWRRPGPHLFALAADGFPIVLAADVLYEKRDVEPLMALVGRLVAPGGLLWLAEPGRRVAEHFLTAATDAGWRGTTERHDGPWPDPRDAGVSVGVHRLRRVEPIGGADV
jgi:predicted nicotinamide N-methyase